LGDDSITLPLITQTGSEVVDFPMRSVRI